MLGIIAIPTFAPRFAVTIGSSRETRMNGTCMSSRRIAQCSSNCSTTVLVKRLDPQVLFLAIYAVQTNLTMLAENVYMPQDLSTLHPGVCETATKRCDSKEFAGTPLPRLRNVVASSRCRVVAVENEAFFSFRASSTTDECTVGKLGQCLGPARSNIEIG